MLAYEKIFVRLVILFFIAWYFYGLHFLVLKIKKIVISIYSLLRCLKSVRSMICEEIQYITFLCFFVSLFLFSLSLSLSLFYFFFLFFQCFLFDNMMHDNEIRFLEMTGEVVVYHASSRIHVMEQVSPPITSMDVISASTTLWGTVVAAVVWFTMCRIIIIYISYLGKKTMMCKEWFEMYVSAYI